MYVILVSFFSLFIHRCASSISRSFISLNVHRRRISPPSASHPTPLFLRQPSSCISLSQLSLPSSVLYADSISLYGVDPTSKQPLGLPIADAYLASHHGSSFTYLGIADGCGWGNGPCRAAQVRINSDFFFYNVNAN